MGFFSSDTVFTAKEMKYENFKHSKVMKDLLADGEIADILDKKDERAVVWQKMKEVAKRTPGGHLTREGLREVLGYFRSGKAANIHPTKEAIPLAERIAKKFLPAGTRRYSYREQNADRGVPENSVREDRFSSRSAFPNGVSSVTSNGVQRSSWIKPVPGTSRFAPRSSGQISPSRRFPSRPAF